MAKNIKELKHKTRRLGIKEGMLFSAESAVGNEFIKPFAIALNTSNSIVALLSSVQGLLGPLSQIKGSKLIEKYSRKKILVKKVFLESLMWLPLILFSCLFYKGILLNALPFFILIWVATFSIITSMGYPAWFSWMGDVVDEKYRGRWFSKRSFLMGIISFTLAILASLFLDYTKKNGWIMAGFATLFLFAFIIRITCIRVIKKQYEPKIKLKKSYRFSFKEFLIKAPKTNFGRFSIFHATLSFSVYISSSLYAIYLLRTLEFSYTTYIIVILSGTFFSLIFLNLWGGIVDKYGSYAAICITSIFLPIVPILWVLSPSPLYLILVPNLISGIANSGFNLASRNFIYDNVHKQKRALAVSYHDLLNGIGIFLGAGLSAILIEYLSITSIKPIILIFIIGGIVRMIVIFFWIPKLKEIKKKKKFKDFWEIEEFVVKKTKPALVEETRELMSMGKYLRER
ncbi:MAG: MFS transporter [Nanoarchaeota archaeon]